MKTKTIKIISRNRFHITYSYEGELYTYWLLGKNPIDYEAEEAFKKFKDQNPELFI